MRIKLGAAALYWHIVGEVDDLIEKAKQLQQRWVKGIGTAARLARVGP